MWTWLKNNILPWPCCWFRVSPLRFFFILNCFVTRHRHRIAFVWQWVNLVSVAWRCLLAMTRMRTMWSDHKRMVVLPWVHVLCNPFIFCHFIDERLIGNGTREFVQLQEDGHGHVCTSSAVTIAYYSLPGNVSIQFFVTATSDLVSSNERQHRVMGMSNRLPWLSEGPCEGIQEE